MNTLSPRNVSNNNSLINTNRNKLNNNKASIQNIQNIPNLNNDNNLESITSNEPSIINRGNENQKNNIVSNSNLATFTTNMATIPTSNQNTIDETKILFNKNKPKIQTLRRSYIFLMDKNELYYCIIDDNFELNQILEFKQVAFILDENEIIEEMKIIKINKDDKVSYIFFLLSKYGLIIIPTDFCRSTLKNIVLNNSYNRANSFKVYYKLECIQDPQDCYHMAINCDSPKDSIVYILSKNNIIERGNL